MITVIKGYARKSVLLEKLVSGTPVRNSEKLVVDLVGVSNLCANADINVIAKQSMSSIDKLAEIYQGIVTHYPNVNSVFIYGNFSPNAIDHLVEISRPFSNHFDITFTVQMGRDFGNRFEIQELQDDF